MKTNILKFTVFLLIIIGSLSSCDKLRNLRTNELIEAIKASECCGKVMINKDEYITMRVLPPGDTTLRVTYGDTSIITYGDTSIIYGGLCSILIIENHTNSVLNYGTEFSLECFNENSWKKIHLNAMWSDIYLGLLAGETGVYAALCPWIDDIKTGTYRIIKEFNLYSNPVFGKFYICTEFEIE